MGPQSIKSETNIKLPFSFILFSIFALVISQLLFLFHGSYFIDGTFRVPALWAGAHLFILGWAVMIGMGAMYQLVPVAFLTPIWNETFGFIQFAITAIGITVFAIFLYISPAQSLIPGLIMLLGFFMFLIQMGMTMGKQEKPNILTLFVATSLVCLFLTISIGIGLIINMYTGFAGPFYTALFKSHMLLGIAGWFTLLIIGFSYKMGPMFALSHGYSMKLGRYVYYTYLSGLIVTIASFFLDHSLLLKIGIFLLFAGFTLFTVHMKEILDKKLKKKLDRPFTFALIAILFGEMIHLIAFLVALVDAFERFAGPLVISYFMFWVAFSIIGYLYKIVPFLWWTYKYSDSIGKEDVPALKDLINEQLALPLFSSFVVGIFVVTVGILTKGSVLFYAGQSIVVIASIVFSYSILAVMRK